MNEQDVDRGQQAETLVAEGVRSIAQASRPEQRHIHIVGGGIAGLTAAYYASQDAEVTLYEASPQLGGRCRAYFDEKLQVRLDNGNHILIGACTETWALIDALGVRDAYHSPCTDYMLRDRESDETWHIAPPFGLGGSMRNYLQVARLCSASSKAYVAEYFDTDSRFYTHVITPLCLSALNTQPERASAKLFAQMLRKAGWHKAAYSPHIPLEDWGAALIEPLRNALMVNGVQVVRECPLKHFEAQGEHVSRLVFADREVEVAENDGVIFALPLPALERLLPNTRQPKGHESIINGHFRTDMKAFKNGTMIGLVGGTADWVFCKKEVISTTTSAASRIPAMDSAELAAKLWEDVCFALDLDAHMPVPPFRILHEKRASFEATPENCALRFTANSDYCNLYIAGDHTATALPATIEGAIASGKIAAQLANASASA